MDYKSIKTEVDAALRKFRNKPKASPANDGKDQIKINFANRRWATSMRFIGCAIQIIFTGKTTLLVKRR